MLGLGTSNLVQKFLVQSLSAYFDDVDRDNVSASLLRGDMSLTNVHLKKSVVDHLGLTSVNLVHGTVGCLHVKVPWLKFGTAPIVIEIDNLFVLLESRADGFATTNRAAELAAMESLGVEARDIFQELDIEEPQPQNAPTGWRGWMASAGRAAKKLISFVEIQVHINNVHIRYTADTFAAGVVLKNLVLSTTSQQSAPKVLTLDGLSMYCNPEDAVLEDAQESDFASPQISPVRLSQNVLEPVCGSIVTSVENGTVLVKGSFDAIVVQLTKEQLDTAIYAEVQKLLVSTARSGSSTLVRTTGLPSEAPNSAPWLEVSLELGEAVVRSLSVRPLEFVGRRLEVGGRFWETSSELNFRMARLTVTAAEDTVIDTTDEGDFVNIVLRKQIDTDVVFTLGPLAVSFRPQVISDVMVFIKSFPSDPPAATDESGPLSHVSIQFCWEAMTIDWYGPTAFAKSHMSRSKVWLEIWDAHFSAKGELGDFSVTHIENNDLYPILSLAKQTDSYLFKFEIQSFPGKRLRVDFDLNAVRLIVVRSVILRLWDFIFESFLPALGGELLSAPEESPQTDSPGLFLTLQVEALEVELPLSMVTNERNPFRLVLRRLAVTNELVPDVFEFDLQEVLMTCLNEPLLPSMRLAASLYRQTPMRIVTKFDAPAQLNLSRLQFCYLADLLQYNILNSDDSSPQSIVPEQDTSVWLIFEFLFAPIDLRLDSNVSRIVTEPVTLTITKYVHSRVQIAVVTAGVSWHDGGLLMGSVGSVSFALDSDATQRSILLGLDDPKFVIHLSRMLRLQSFFFDDFDQYKSLVTKRHVPVFNVLFETILNVNLGNAQLVLPLKGEAGFTLAATLLSFNQTWADANLHRKLVGNTCQLSGPDGVGIGSKIDFFLSSLSDSKKTLVKCSCEPIELRLRFSQLKEFQLAIDEQFSNTVALDTGHGLSATNSGAHPATAICDKSMELFFHSVSVLVINDFALLQNTPLLNLVFRNLQAKSDTLVSSLVGNQRVTVSSNVTTNLAVSVFNRASVDWEPLIESVGPSGAFVKLQIAQTQFSDDTTKSQQLVAEIDGAVQLNLTDALIQTAMQHAKDWAQATRGANDSVLFAPYSVLNFTGETLNVSFNQLGYTVPNREEVCLAGIGVEVGGARRRIMIKVAGDKWSVPRVPLDKPGLYLFTLRPGVVLIATVSVTADGRKQLRLSSTASVINVFGVSLWLKVGLHYEVLIAPGESAPVPLGEECGVVRIRLDGSTVWSGSVALSDVRAKTKLWQISANGQFVYVSGRSVTLSYQDQTASRMTVSVFAPIRLRSTIPVMVDYHLAANDDQKCSGSIPLNGESFLTTLPLTGRLTIRFEAFEGTFSSPEPVTVWPADTEQIRPDGPDFYLPIKLVDAGKNFLHLRLFYDQVAGQPPCLTLHSPQWLVCTDVPKSLRFAYDSADEWAADSWGGVQWVAAPDARSYAVPLDSKAKRIGGYLGEAHSEYVAVDTVGATSFISVRQDRVLTEGNRRGSVVEGHRRGSIEPGRRGSLLSARRGSALGREPTTTLLQELAVRVTSSPSGMIRDFPVKITTVSPRFVLVNTLVSSILFVRQHSGEHEAQVGPNAQVPFKWWALTGDAKQLQVSRKQDAWSQPFGVEQVGESLVVGVEELRVEIRIFHGVFYIVFSSTVLEEPSPVEETSLVASSVFRLVMPALAVSFTGPIMSRETERGELLLLNAKLLVLNVSLSPVANEIDLRCAEIQLDDLRDEAKFPVVWSRRKQRDPTVSAIEVSASWAPPQLGDTTLNFESCLIKIGDVDLALDFGLISDLTDLFIKTTQSTPPSYPYKHIPSLEQLPVGSLRIWSFKQFLLFGMRLNLSFNPGSVSNVSVLHRAIASMAAVERSPLRFKALSLTDFRASRSNMLSIVTEHYKHQLYREMRTIMGSAEAFGNPIGLLGSLSTGVTDLFYEPFAAIRDMQKPEDVANVADKTAKGAKSFFKNTAFGVFNSMSKLAATSAQTLSILTEDAEYLSERSEFNNKNKPAHLGDGMVLGATSFGRGLISGLSGLVTKPVEGMEQNGFAGFAKGTMKGVGGFFLKPVAGLLDFAKSTADGVVVATKDSTLDVPPLRLPRMLYGHDRCIRVIDPDDSLLRWYLVQLDGIPPNLTYVSHIYDAQNGTIVTASATHLIATDTHARRITLLVPIWRVLGVVGDLDRLVLTINVLVPNRTSTSQLDLELSSVFVLKSVQQLIATAMES